MEAAKGHTVVVDEAVAPNCTNTGLTEGSHCSVCGEILVAQEIVDALGHKEKAPVKENEVEASCTEAGSYDLVVYCETCNSELSRETVVIDALGHTPGDEADCENAQTCTVCGKELEAAKGHTEVIDAAVEADCENTGLTEGKHCSACDKVLVEQEVVAAKGHKDEAVKDHNCDACGEKLSNCADSDDEDLNCDYCGERMPVEVVDNSGKLQYTVEGEKVTVTNDKACMMYYWDEANQKIVIIEADEGSYVFTVGEHMDKVHLVVKGDITGDGEMNQEDLTALTKYLLDVADGKDAELSAIAAFIADVNGDGEITSADRVLLARSLLAPTHPLYRPYTW